MRKIEGRQGIERIHGGEKIVPNRGEYERERGESGVVVTLLYSFLANSSCSPNFGNSESNICQFGQEPS